MKKEELQKQLNAYREKTCKLPGGQIYQMATEIITIHGVAWAMENMSERAWKVIERANEKKTLEGCAKYVMNEARKSLGGNGDLPPEEMTRLIGAYFAG